ARQEAARAAVHARSRASPRPGARNSRRVRRCVHADGAAATGCGGGGPARAGRNRPGDDLSGCCGWCEHRRDSRTLPARGDAGRAAGARSMTVTVHMHGNLRRFMPGGADRLEMTVAPGTTIESFLAALGAAGDTWLDRK